MKLFRLLLRQNSVMSSVAEKCVVIVLLICGARVLVGKCDDAESKELVQTLNRKTASNTDTVHLQTGAEMQKSDSTPHITPRSLRTEPKSLESQENEAFSVPDNIKNIVMIPGSGEFVYDTKIQQRYTLTRFEIPYGPVLSVNQHSKTKKSDAVLSLDQLKQDLPNVEWISVVVYWFASDTNIKDCKLYPAVEYWNAYTETEEWSVAGISRRNVRLVSKDSDGKSKHGGTVSDAALVRYIEELHRRGYKVMLYPKLLLAANNEKWRGKLNGTVWSISSFFNSQYNFWIYHYANIARRTNVEAFIIGSDMADLTKIKHRINEYPVVTELANLAQKVKILLGSEVIITYAAHWSEYHSDGGQYFLDQLWASEYIDVVGINAYFPLTDGPEPPAGYSVQDVIDGWTKGVGYDYYRDYTWRQPKKIEYTDSQRAWKNIEKWWTEVHINPKGQKTDWQPKMKKIWFTEFGFESVNGCTNQYEILLVGSLSERKYPRHSNRKASFLCQKVAIEGTLKKWRDSEMVERMFLYAWDARPFPQFPDLVEVWNDCGDHETGHWIQGKIEKVFRPRGESSESRRRDVSFPGPSLPPQSFGPERGFTIIFTLRDHCPPTMRIYDGAFVRRTWWDVLNF